MKIMRHLKVTHKRWLADQAYYAYERSVVARFNLGGVDADWDSDNGLSISYGGCTLSGITEGISLTGDLDFECEQIALMNGMTIDEVAFQKTGQELELTVSILNFSKNGIKFSTT